MSTLRSLLSGFLICAALAGCGGKVELLKDISEMEANDALAALLDADISAEKLPGKDGMVSLSVEKAQFSQAIRVLNAEGLPQERYARMGDVFRKEGLISSPLEERARYLWALSQELQATMAQIDGVIKARVHLVLPEKASGIDPAVPSSAAVFIKHKAGYNLDESMAQIKRLISNSIPGLSAEKVTVVMLPAIPKSAMPRSIATAPEMPEAKPAEVAIPEHLRVPMIWAGMGGLLLAVLVLGFLIWRKWGRALGRGDSQAGDKATGLPAQVTRPSAVTPGSGTVSSDGVS